MANEVSCSVIPTATLFSTVVETSYVPTVITTATPAYATSFSVSVETISIRTNGSISVDQITQTVAVVQTTSVPVVVTTSMPVTRTRSLAYATLASTSCSPSSMPPSPAMISPSLASGSDSARVTPLSSPSLISQSVSLSPLSSISDAKIAATGVKNIVSASSIDAQQSTSYRTVFFTSTITNNGVASTQQYSSQTAVAVGSASNTAAITGGVVGGILVVVLAAIALFLLLRRKRRLSSQAFSGEDIFQPGLHNEKDSSSVIDDVSGNSAPVVANSNLSSEPVLWHTGSTPSIASSRSGGIGSRVDQEGLHDDIQVARRLSGYLPRVDEDEFQSNPADLYTHEISAYNGLVPIVAPLSPKSQYSSRSLHSLQSPPSPRSLHSPYSFHSQQSPQSPQSYFPQYPPPIDRRRSSQYSISSMNSQSEHLSNHNHNPNPAWAPTHVTSPSSSSSVKHLMRPGSESPSFGVSEERSQQRILKEAEANSRMSRGPRNSDVIEEEAEAPPKYI